MSRVRVTNPSPPPALTESKNRSRTDNPCASCGFGVPATPEGSASSHDRRAWALSQVGRPIANPSREVIDAEVVDELPSTTASNPYYYQEGCDACCMGPCLGGPADCPTPQSNPYYYQEGCDACCMGPCLGGPPACSTPQSNPYYYQEGCDECCKGPCLGGAPTCPPAQNPNGSAPPPLPAGSMPVAYPVVPPGILGLGQGCLTDFDCGPGEYCHAGGCMPSPWHRNVGVTVEPTKNPPPWGGAGWGPPPWAGAGWRGACPYRATYGGPGMLASYAYQPGPIENPRGGRFRRGPGFRGRGWARRGWGPPWGAWGAGYPYAYPYAYPYGYAEPAVTVGVTPARGPAPWGAFAYQGGVWPWNGVAPMPGRYTNVSSGPPPGASSGVWRRQNADGPLALALYATGRPPQDDNPALWPAMLVGAAAAAAGGGLWWYRRRQQCEQRQARYLRNEPMQEPGKSGPYYRYIFDRGCVDLPYEVVVTQGPIERGSNNAILNAVVRGQFDSLEHAQTQLPTPMLANGNAGGNALNPFGYGNPAAPSRGGNAQTVEIARGVKVPVGTAKAWLQYWLQQHPKGGEKHAALSNALFQLEQGYPDRRANPRFGTSPSQHGSARWSPAFSPGLGSAGGWQPCRVPPGPMYAMSTNGWSLPHQQFTSSMLGPLRTVSPPANVTRNQNPGVMQASEQPLAPQLQLR